MGERVIHVSDLSGETAPLEQLVSVVVVEHPELDTPVKLEALPAELEPLKKLGIKAVTLEVQLPGDEEEPVRYVVTTANFDKLATDRPMVEVLAGAERIASKRRGSNGGAAANGEAARDHNTLEWAGTPHKGKTSPEEAQLVRENLEAVNARLISQGLRPVDPANPDHARRYGFEGAAAEVAAAEEKAV
jgi:hypothetical protein